MRLYIETRIAADMERVRERTHDPVAQARWELRFTRIRPLPRLLNAPERFSYSTTVLPFVHVTGVGVHTAERVRPGAARTSALRFTSDHPLSPITDGSGFWRYLRCGSEVRFLTGYDYRTRWGRAGRVADRVVFRRLMGWATAWSFDRLRLWCERGIAPEKAARSAIAGAATRASVAAAGSGAALAAPSAWGLVLAAAAVLAALLAPPLPTTPAARRCLRRPPDTPVPATARARIPQRPLTRGAAL